MVVQFVTFFQATQNRNGIFKEGSATNTFWKRRSSAASFSSTGDIRQASWHLRSAIHHAPRRFQHVSGVHCAIGFTRADQVCNSSINRMTLPSCLARSLTRLLNVLQTHRDISPQPPARHIQRQYPAAFQPFRHFAVDKRCARPSTMAVLPTPGSPISTGYF